jgi:serine/threonine-protein kinase
VISTDTAPAPKPPIVWPWIAVIVALSLTAITIIVAILVQPSGTPSPSPSEPGGSSSVTPSSTPTATNPATVTVLSTDVIGFTVSDAYNYLTGLGLQVDAVPGESLPNDDERVLTVYEATPLGALKVGDVIRLTYYVASTDLPGEPTPDPTPSQ